MKPLRNVRGNERIAETYTGERGVFQQPKEMMLSIPPARSVFIRPARRH